MNSVSVAMTTNEDRKQRHASDYAALMAQYQSLEQRLLAMESRLEEAQKTAEIHLQKYVETKCREFVLQATNERLVEAVRKLEAELSQVFANGFAKIDFIVARLGDGSDVVIANQKETIQ